MGLINKLLGKFLPNLVADVGPGSKINGRIERRHALARVKIGRDSLLAGILVAEASDSRLTVGDRVFIGGGSLVDCRTQITIEDDVLVSYQVLIMDSNNHSLRASERIGDLKRWRENQFDWSKVVSAPILIRSKAWIGARAIITKGVTIGEGAIIGAGAVVTRDVPPYTVAAGNPARVVRELAPDER